MSKDKAEALELNEPDEKAAEAAREKEKIVHCPKCGFVFGASKK